MQADLDRFHFKDLPVIFDPDDVVVVNNTRVIPARLIGRRGRRADRLRYFSCARLKADVWEALVRPGKRLKEGALVDFGEAA